MQGGRMNAMIGWGQRMEGRERDYTQSATVHKFDTLCTTSSPINAVSENLTEETKL